jgi:CP family cyanate transporter-like MFS transporter
VQPWWRLAFALLLCAVAVRPLAVSLGPLLPGIQDDLGASSFAAGLVGMLPVVCLGVFAPVGARLASRIRPEAALAVALALAVGFGAARAFAPSVLALVVLTIGLGIGMGMAGPIPSMLIKARAPRRSGLMTSVHGMGVVGGSVLGVLLIVPLATVAGGWRGGTLLVSVPILVCTLVGLLVLGRGGRPVDDGRRSGVSWRDPVAWLLAGIFGLQSFIYWALVIWLPAILLEAGWSLSEAATVVALYQVSSFIGVATVGIVAERWGSRRQQLLVAGGTVTGALVGYLFLPEAAAAWITLGGFALGAALPLALTLPVDLGSDARDAGDKAGLMLLVGYLVAAGGPAMIGLVREVTLDHAPVFMALVSCGAAFVALAARVPHVAGPPLGPAELAGPRRTR